jgi:hypothetical protein
MGPAGIGGNLDATAVVPGEDDVPVVAVFEVAVFDELLHEAMTKRQLDATAANARY